MGTKKPKSSDYQPSEADKTSASIALQRYNTFKTKYQPILVAMRDKAMKNGTVKLARGLGGADAMQALTESMPTPQAAQGPSTGTEVASGLAGQLAKATAQGREVDNNIGVNVLAAANEQAATAQSGLSAIARINTSDALARAQRKQSESEAKTAAAMQLGSAVIGTGMKNMDGGGTFFKPAGDTLDADGAPIVDGSFKNRKAVGLGRLVGRVS